MASALALSSDLIAERKASAAMGELKRNGASTLFTTQPVKRKKSGVKNRPERNALRRSILKRARRHSVNQEHLDDVLNSTPLRPRDELSLDASIAAAAREIRQNWNLWERISRALWAFADGNPFPTWELTDELGGAR